MSYVEVDICEYTPGPDQNKLNLNPLTINQDVLDYPPSSSRTQLGCCIQLMPLCLNESLTYSQSIQILNLKDKD